MGTLGWSWYHHHQRR